MIQQKKIFIQHLKLIHLIGNKIPPRKLALMTSINLILAKCPTRAFFRFKSNSQKKMRGMKTNNHYLLNELLRGESTIIKLIKFLLLITIFEYIRRICNFEFKFYIQIFEIIVNK